MKKKILAITGIRSDYDLMYPVLNAINKNKNFDLKMTKIVHASKYLYIICVLKRY